MNFEQLNINYLIRRLINNNYSIKSPINQIMSLVEDLSDWMSGLKSVKLVENHNKNSIKMLILFKYLTCT